MVHLDAGSIEHLPVLQLARIFDLQQITALSAFAELAAGVLLAAQNLQQLLFTLTHSSSQYEYQQEEGSQKILFLFASGTARRKLAKKKQTC